MYTPVLVCPYSLDDLFQCIAVVFEVFLGRFMRYYPCLQQDIHYLFESEIYVSVTLLVVLECLCEVR